MRFALAIAGLCGFIALSYELLWYRLFAYASGGTAPVFALLLAFYLYGLAAGGVLVRLLCRRANGVGLNLLAWLTFVGNLASYAVVPTLAAACSVNGCLRALPVVVISTTFLGATLPLISHLAIPPDAVAGTRVSFIYFANIIGSVGGTLITGYILMDRLPSSGVALVLALLGLGVTAMVLFAARRTAATSVVVLLAAGSSPATRGLYDGLYERLLYKERYYTGLRFANTVEDRAGVINISSTGRVFGGGVYDGDARIDLMRDPNRLVRAVAVPAFHPRPRRVLMIGLSMGAWAQVLVNLPGVERLTIVEINPGYLSLIPRYPDVASLLHNPKVDIVIDDGRRWLARHPHERFDLIVANITFHWREHATNLLSADFLELVREHMTPDGVYYYNSTFSPDVLKTGFTVFPFGFRFMSFMAVSDHPLRFDAEAWAAILPELQIDGRELLQVSDPRQRQRLREIVALTQPDRSGPGVPALEWREATLRRFANARVITDDNMASEWQSTPTEAWDP